MTKSASSLASSSAARAMSIGVPRRRSAAFFALGLARGLAFCLTERHDGDLSFTVPEAALARCRTAPKGAARRVSR